ncbi:hypothetical protein ACVIGB_000960 [Bradyrhizobium sp. USDA 4341]
MIGARFIDFLASMDHDDVMTTEQNVRGEQLIDDAGEKIGGARKDWRERHMSLDDLAGMTDAEAILHVKKDSVWPQPDWEAVVANGMPADTAAHVKLIRDRLAKEPRPLRNSADPSETRKGYVRMVSSVRNKMMSARNLEDVKNAYFDIVDEYGIRNIKTDASAQAAFYSVYQGRSCPFTIASADSRKVRDMLVEGFPGKVPAWRKGIKIYPAASGDGFILTKKGLQTGPVFETESAAWKWLQDEGAKPKVQKTTKDLVVPDRPHLDQLERNGLPDRRAGRDVSADDFISAFGFRGVEFGLWLPNDERQKVLNLAYDAFHDLADVLDWDPSRMSLDGTLAVAFGARGGGRHAAHYEPGRKVVNLTRIKGAGSLAHEYAHAFDNWAGEVDRDAPTRTVASGSGWYHRVQNVRSMLKNLDEDQVHAWDVIDKKLFSVALSREEAIDLTNTKISHIAVEVDRFTAIRATELAKPVGSRNLPYVRKINEYLTSQNDRKRALSAHLERLASQDCTSFGSRKSSYSVEAGKLCGKSGEYWMRPTEMFARAFESYVFDRLREKGAVSDYLVHGVEEDRYVDPETYKGNPYPVGDERKEINRSIETVVLSMKPRVELEKTVAPAP